MKHRYLFIFFLLLSPLVNAQSEKLIRIIGREAIALPVKPKHASLYKSDSISTTGNEYHYPYWQMTEIRPPDIYCFLHSSYVTVGDYQAFQSDLIDSAARELIYNGVDKDVDAVKYLKTDPKQPFAISDRQRNRQRFPLDRDRSFDYDNVNLWPLLACLYMPQADRFYKLRCFDQQKIFYRYYTFGNSDTCIVPTFRNDYAWAKTSVYERDVWSVLAQLYRTQTESPVTGISADQAIAYCHWKQGQIQDQIDREGLRFNVEVTLPEKDELTGFQSDEPVFIIPERDYSVHWAITPDAYNLFVEAVRDSLLREYLYRNLENDDQASRYLDLRKKDYYFRKNWMSEEFHAFDLSAREENRWLFPLNYTSTIQKDAATAEAIRTFRETDTWKDCSYRYFFIDAKSRADSAHWRQRVLPDDLDVFRQEIVTKASGSYHRRAENYAGEGRFIRRESVPVVPQSNPGNRAFMHTISYHQALAFWHWKYRIQSAKHDDNWQDYVLPDEQQFEALQRGEQVIAAEIKTSYPSPLFRYVIHVYPKP